MQDTGSAHTPLVFVVWFEYYFWNIVSLFGTFGNYASAYASTQPRHGGRGRLPPRRVDRVAECGTRGAGPGPFRVSARVADVTLAADTRGNLRGIVLMILATACLTGMHGLVRHASRDLHPFEIAFFRNLLVPLYLLPWLIRAGWSSLRPRRFAPHASRAAIGVIALLSWFYALSLLPLAEATALNFSSTLFATVGAAVILREEVRRYRWIAAVVGFAGVVIILQPGREAASLGGILVILSSIFWAGSLLMAKSLTRHDSTLGIVVLMAAMSAGMSLPAAVLVWSTPSLSQFGTLMVIALLGTLGYLFYTQALREAEAGVVFPLDFLRLLWAVLFGYLVFGELLDLSGWIGAILIAGSAAYIGYREGRTR